MALRTQKSLKNRVGTRLKRWERLWWEYGGPDRLGASGLDARQRLAQQQRRR